MTTAPRAKLIAFRIARAAFYRVVIPTANAAPPIRRLSLRVVRHLVSRPPLAIQVPDPIEVDGLTLFHNSARPSLTMRGLALGTYERSVSEALRSELSANSSFLDIGSHVGYYALLASRIVGPSGHVWAFEPDPDNRDYLQRNIEANHAGGVISIVPAAVGSVSGHAILRTTANDSGGSTISPMLNAAQEIVVDVTTLDEWWTTIGQPAVQLVKIDVEGAEFDVLDGMGILVKKCPDLRLIIECQADTLERSARDPSSMFTSLRQLGFHQIEALAENGRSQYIDSVADMVRVLEQSRWYPVNLFCRRTI